MTLSGYTADGHIIDVNGTRMKQRRYLRITGDSVTSGDSGGKTIVTIDSITDLVDDTTPQLGGDLDGQDYSITTTGDITADTVHYTTLDPAIEVGNGANPFFDGSSDGGTQLEFYHSSGAGTLSFSGAGFNMDKSLTAQSYTASGSGISAINQGLVVNASMGSTAYDDFTVSGDTVRVIHVTADTNTLVGLGTWDLTGTTLTIPSSLGGESTTVSDTATVNLTLAGSDITADLIEAGAEAILDLQDLQGAVTDAQVPDNITITESDPQVGGVTNDSVCQANGSSVNCDLTKDASGACAAGSVCTGGHSHVASIKHGIGIENAVATDDFFFGEVAFGTETYTSIYCKTADNGAALDVTIGGAAINGASINCTPAGVLDDSLGGTTTGSVGDEVKLAVVTSDTTYLMVILNGTTPSQ